MERNLFLSCPIPSHPMFLKFFVPWDPMGRYQTNFLEKYYVFN